MAAGATPRAVGSRAISAVATAVTSTWEPARIWAGAPHWGRGFYVWNAGAWAWYGGQYYVSSAYPGWVWIGPPWVWDGTQWTSQEGYWTTADLPGQQTPGPQPAEESAPPE